MDELLYYFIQYGLAGLSLYLVYKLITIILLRQLREINENISKLTDTINRLIVLIEKQNVILNMIINKLNGDNDEK